MKRVGLIGLGHQTQSELIPALLQLSPQVEVVALCDPQADIVQQIQKQFPQARVYSSLTEFFEQETELDAVVTAVPHFLYEEICEQALARGIAVFKEKPFAMNGQQAQEFVELSQKTHCPVFTVTKRAQYQAYQRGQELLAELGPVYQYSARQFIPHGNIYEGWRSRQKTAGGGVFLDMGYHLLEVLLSYFGRPSEVHMFTSNTGKAGYSYEVEDAASLLLQHSSGVHGCFQVACLGGPKQESIEVRGQNGVLQIGKDRVQLHSHFGEVLRDEAFAVDGIASTRLAMEQFFFGNWEIWQRNLQHNLEMMHIIDTAYGKRSV